MVEGHGHDGDAVEACFATHGHFVLGAQIVRFNLGFHSQGVSFGYHLFDFNLYL